MAGAHEAPAGGLERDDVACESWNSALFVLLRRLRLYHHGGYMQLSVARPRIAKIDARQLRSPGTSFENDVTYSLVADFLPELHDDPFSAGDSVSMQPRRRSSPAAFARRRRERSCACARCSSRIPA